MSMWPEFSIRKLPTQSKFYSIWGLGMDPFQHRHNARIVAYIDSITTGLMVVSLTLWIIFVAEFGDEIEKAENGNVAIAILCIVFAVFGIMTAISFWATVHLLRATKEGAEPVQALRSSRIWKGVAVTFLALSLPITLYDLYLILAFLFHFVLRVIMIYFVNKFTKELHAHVSTKIGGSLYQPMA